MNKDYEPIYFQKMLKLPFDIEFDEADFVLGLGYKFWIRAIDEKRITDVEQSLNLIQSFPVSQNLYQNNFDDDNYNLECSKFITQMLEEGTNNTNIEVIILVLGFKFWQKIVQSVPIKSAQKCIEILENFNESIVRSETKKFEEFYVEKSESNNEIDSLSISHMIKVEMNEDVGLEDDLPVLDDPLQEENIAQAVPVKIEELKKKRKGRWRKGEKELAKKIVKLESIVRRDKPTKKKGLNASCDYCEKTFSSYNTLGLHVDVDHHSMKEEFDKKYKVFKCVLEDCQETFYQKSMLLFHYKRQHKEEDKNSSLAICVNGVIIERVCKICGEALMEHNLQAMEDHIEYKHGLKRKLHKCLECGTEFHFKIHLERHLKHHDEKVPSTVCKDCGLVTETVADMRRHRYRKHPKKQPPKPRVNCIYCDFVAETPHKCKTHMYKVHDHDALFCDICGFKANGPDYMWRHKQKSHSVKFKCDYCDKILTSKQNYQWHVRKNHEHMLLQCSKCDKRFLEQQTLDDHMNGHLLLRPHKCQFCGRGFQTLVAKERHLKLCLKNT